ncbi:MAG TPA: alkyl sulfatase dimerization domain-containing protein [Acidimicrobiia bacterium]|jgi:glyoxylase-like metal-dependent hydrolase (beta-lactamase superfamily II)
MADDTSGSQPAARHVLDLVQEGVRPSDAAEAMRDAQVDAVEVAPRTWIVQPSLVNVYLLETDDGLVMIDSGLQSDADAVHGAVRARFDAPLHTVVFTHGHLDHAFGLGRFLEDGERPRIVAHENVVRRFHDYARLARLNALVNKRQWQLPDMPWWPSADDDFCWPTDTYRDSLELDIGGERFVCRHGQGETDDHTWVWVPGRGTLASGDFFCMTMPNCGNPNKVQRYPEEWADADEEMAALGAELMLPGHGEPIRGAERIRRGLLEQAEFLRSVVAQAIDGLNAGLRHDEIARSIRVPEHLAGLDHLQPTYDRPEFIARNVIRRYGGWFDGYAADLLPASGEEIGAEIVALAGGMGHVVTRARELAATNLPLACHLAEWAYLADPDDPAAKACVVEVFSARAAADPSLMSKGVYQRLVRTAEGTYERED